MKYKTVEHPSDIGIEAYGKDQKGSFENAAYGMLDLMFDLKNVEEKETISVKIEASDKESLLVNWLNEILYLIDSKNIVFSSFKIVKISDKMLEAEIFGEKFDDAKHQVKTGIKAATFNQIDVSENKVKVIFDV